MTVPTIQHFPRRFDEICRTGYSPPPRGGVAAPLRRCREASEAAQTGWSLTRRASKTHSETFRCERPPRPLQQRRLRDICLVSRPPLLWEEGNIPPGSFI